MRIAVDAMGGDYAPVEIVKGAVIAAVKYEIPIALVGAEGSIKQELNRCSAVSKSLIEIRHASEIVEMDEHPANAIRKKSDSSIVIAANMVKNNEAQAMVSAGNTGAAMAVATLKLGRIRGIDRPAICSLLPTLKGKAVLIDAGANVDCSVENLLQFALMGNEYAARVFKIDHPRVGLLSIGEEASKGDTLTKSANAQLSQSGLNFIGNVEGKEIFRGEVDVIVCDGFAGNIVLKVAEGIAEFIQKTLNEEIRRSLIYKLGASLVLPAMKKAKSRLDYTEYGGAPLLGINGVCIISHGRSDAKAICNAIRAAANAVENDVVEYISASVRNNELIAL